MEYQVLVGGHIYTMEDIQSVSITQPLFDVLSAGNACSAELDISFWPTEEPPNMAEIVPYCRKSRVEPWIQLGVFYIDTRSRKDSLMEIIAYDSMLKSEITWTPQRGFTFPCTMEEAAEDVAYSMGVSLDERCSFYDYVIEAYPAKEYSRRDLLRDIASSHYGNWIITAQNKLLLIPLFTSLPEETHYLVTENGDAITFGGVRILV